MNNFENNMQQLKNILLQLEKDKLSLQEQIELFEKSNILFCKLKSELKSFEIKIEDIKSLYKPKDNEDE